MSMQLTCSNCNSLVSEDVTFCPHCGTPLHEQAQVQRLTPDELIKKPLPEVLKQYDSIAGIIVTISGILISFYAGGIFASKIRTNVIFNAFVYALPIILLLMAIFFAIRVFYPRGYLNNTYMELIDIKEKRLRRSTTFLGIAIGVLAVSLFIYLTQL